MSRDNGEPRGLWPSEEDIVPLSGAATLTVPSATNGDRSDHTAVVDAEIQARLQLDRRASSELTQERLMPVPNHAPTRGWRRAVHLVTAGIVVPGQSAAERRRRELVSHVKTPIVGCRKVAFISRKGGVGKTTTCLLVGHTFALYRGDRVVAVDANPDAGTLAHRLRRETSETIATLLRDRAQLSRYADVRAYSSQAPSRLEVIAGDERSAIADQLTDTDVTSAVSLLERHYNLICLDTSAGVLGSSAQGVLRAADQLVVVTPPTLDGARAASSTLDWLCESGHTDLVRSAVAVLNGIRAGRSRVDVARIEEHFASRCRTCIRVPWEPHLETGAEVELDELWPATREAFLEVAAAVATGFATPTPTEGRS